MFGIYILYLMSNRNIKKTQAHVAVQPSIYQTDINPLTSYGLCKYNRHFVTKAFTHVQTFQFLMIL